MTAEPWTLLVLAGLLVTAAVVGLVIVRRAGLVDRLDEWRAERLLRSMGLSLEDEEFRSATEGTHWIEHAGSTIISETGSFGWLVSGYRLNDPPSANGADVARRQLDLSERRQSVRWDDPLRDMGERIFRLDAPLRGFNMKDDLDDLVELGRARVVVDTECGYPDSYVLRAGDLPQPGRTSSPVRDDDWVYVEAWDAS